MVSLPGRTASAVLALLVLAACAGSSAFAAAGPDSRLLVKFGAGTSATKQARLASAVGARAVSSINDLDVRVIGVSSSGAANALASLRKSPFVVYAETDSILKPQELLPDDPSFPSQYGIAGGAWGWVKTRTTQAWDITRGDPSVVVAILDTGLKTQGLSDFGGQVVPGWNVMKSSSDMSTFAGNHGTYVAGVVGLALNNAVGSAGFCPGCRIMPVQVGTDAGALLSDIASGITWAADHGARVANMIHVSVGDSRRDRRRRYDQHGCEARRLELRQLGEGCST